MFWRVLWMSLLAFSLTRQDGRERLQEIARWEGSIQQGGARENVLSNVLASSGYGMLEILGQKLALEVTRSDAN
jgi:hypothetical protein